MAKRETEYMVLFKPSGDAGYVPVGTSTASNGRTALRRHFNPDDEIAGEAVAVPLSSWKPEPVRREVQTRLRIG